MEHKYSKLVSGVFVFVITVLFFAFQDRYIGPGRIPSAKPLHWDDIINNFEKYIFLGIVMSILFVKYKK